MNLRRTLIVPAALLAGLLVACGGEDRLSAAEFRTEANAICQNLNAELQNTTTALLAEDADALSTVDKVARYFVDIALPVARRKLDQLEELNPPEGDQADLDDLVEEGRNAVTDVEDGLEEDAASIMTKGANPLDDFDDLAREIGLDGCAAPERPSQRDDASTTTSAPASTSTTTKP